MGAKMTNLDVAPSFILKQKVVYFLSWCYIIQIIP